MSGWVGGWMNIVTYACLRKEVINRDKVRGYQTEING